MEGISGSVAEIACDESGFSGTDLLDASSRVMAHASVDLSPGEAEDLMTTLRTGHRFSLTEVKSGRFLRGRGASESLEWFLSAVNGRAHVHLVDKEYFLVTRIVDLFLTEPSYAAGTRLTQQQRPAARALYRAGRTGGQEWGDFLAAFVEMVRTKHRRGPDRSLVEHFLQARDALAANGLDPTAEGVLEGLTRDRVRTIVTRLTDDDRSIPPPLEPMLPAVAETVLFWSGGQRQVLVIHDEQSALTADRLRRLQRVLADGADLSPLAGVVTVDSRDDPRVQVADLLAGIARRFAANGEGGPAEHFVSSTSLHDPQQ